MTLCQVAIKIWTDGTIGGHRTWRNIRQTFMLTYVDHVRCPPCYGPVMSLAPAWVDYCKELERLQGWPWNSYGFWSESTGPSDEIPSFTPIATDCPYGTEFKRYAREMALKKFNDEVGGELEQEIPRRPKTPSAEDAWRKMEKAARYGSRAFSKEGGDYWSDGSSGRSPEKFLRGIFQSRALLYRPGVRNVSAALGAHGIWL